MIENMLTVKDLMYMFGVHRTTIYRWIHNEGFPKPTRKLGKLDSLWNSRDVYMWQYGCYPPAESSNANMLTMEDLESRYKVKRATIYMWISRLSFPKPYRGAVDRIARWKHEDVEAWEQRSQEGE